MHPKILLWWKTNFGGRQSSEEDDHRWKMTFGGRRPSVEDDLWWRTTFDGRRPVVEDDLRWKMTFAGSLHAAYSALLHSFQRTMLDIRYQDAGSSVLNVLKPTSTAIENIIMVHILISNFQLAQKEIQGNILIIKSRTTSITTIDKEFSTAGIFGTHDQFGLVPITPLWFKS